MVLLYGFIIILWFCTTKRLFAYYMVAQIHKSYPVQSYVHLNDAANAFQKHMLSSKNPFLEKLLGGLSFVNKGAQRALRH